MERRKKAQYNPALDITLENVGAINLESGSMIYAKIKQYFGKNPRIVLTYRNETGYERTLSKFNPATVPACIELLNKSVKVWEKALAKAVDYSGIRTTGGSRTDSWESPVLGVSALQDAETDDSDTREKLAIIQAQIKSRKK